MKTKKLILVLTLFASLTLLFACSGGGSSGGSGKNFTDVTKVENWLASQKGGASPDDPIPFRVQQNLQNMASPESNWQKLLTSINTAGLYVALDLSGSTMPTTEFDADGGTKTGKQFIVSLVLPDSTESVAGVLYGHFGNLKTAKAKNIDYLVGDTGPAGGFVFYDKGDSADGWRYLEAAPADMPAGLRWVAESYGNNYGNFPNITGTETGIGSGKRNTKLILAKDANAPAAKACNEYSNNGKTDWFLPSKDELNLMYRNLKVNGRGGFENEMYWYWSSSQYDNFDVRSAWDQRFDSGRQGSYLYKYDDLSVRAVRAF